MAEMLAKLVMSDAATRDCPMMATCWVAAPIFAPVLPAE